MSSIKREFIRQFSRPQGLLGEIAGMVMATRTSNLERNEGTIALLDPQPTDTVLEIGPGPGVTLSKLLKIVTEGKVVAIDHSKTMLNQCRKRNKKAVQSGQLELIEASYDQLSSFSSQFDKIIAVNVLQFKGPNNEVLKRLYDALKPEGRLAVTYQPRGHDVSNESGQRFADELAKSLEHINFERVRVEILPSEPVNAFCVLAEK